MGSKSRVLRSCGARVGVALLVLYGAWPVWGQSARAEPALPKPVGYVSDFAHVMSPGAIAHLNRLCGKVERETTLAEHDDESAIWHFGDAAGCEAVKRASVGNLKQVFTHEGRQIDWFDRAQGEGEWYLRHATQVKNIWVPYGE